MITGWRSPVYNLYEEIAAATPYNPMKEDFMPAGLDLVQLQFDELTHRRVFITFVVAATKTLGGRLNTPVVERII